MEALTRKEEEVLRILYRLERAFVKEVIAELPGKKKPAYTTISTVIRNLEEKGFVGHEVFGNTHRYYPVRPISELRRRDLGDVLQQYFSGSHKALVSHFARNRDLSRKDVEDILRLIDEQEQE